LTENNGCARLLLVESVVGSAHQLKHPAVDWPGEETLSAENSLGGWSDIPIRVTVVGKIKELMPNKTTALVEVSGAQFVATFDPVVVAGLDIGAEVLIDEEYASIVGTTPAPARDSKGSMQAG
jgi:hypothetical protein